MFILLPFFLLQAILQAVVWGHIIILRIWTKHEEPQYKFIWETVGSCDIESLSLRQRNYNWISTGPQLLPWGEPWSRWEDILSLNGTSAAMIGPLLQAAITVLSSATHIPKQLINFQVIKGFKLQTRIGAWVDLVMTWHQILWRIKDF